MRTWGRGRGPGDRSRSRVRLSRPRTLLGWVLASAGPAALTAVLLQGRDVLALPTDLMMFFTLVVFTALVGGLAPSLVCALLSFASLNYFFTEPTGGLTIAEPENALALVVFGVVAVAVASVVDLAERRRADAQEARAEATALADLSLAVLAGRDTPQEVARELARRFAADVAIVLTRTSPSAPWTQAAAHRTAVAPHRATAPDPRDPPFHAVGDVAVSLPGHRLSPTDERVFRAFAEQAAVVLDRAALRRQAERTRELEHVNAARTAILAAASHDLRTPLAAVRAAVDGLGRHGPPLAEADRTTLVEAIDTGTARLERLIDNLLDLSRLQMGAVHPDVVAVSLDEVVPLALDGLDPAAITLDLPEDLPLVLTDPGLLERIIANLATNAALHARSEAPARVTARLEAGRVVIGVIDSGPGMSPEEIDRAFTAFERLGATEAHPGGLGLGLAVVHGLSDALGVRITPHPTPGGGLTIDVAVPLAPPTPTGRPS